MRCSHSFHLAYGLELFHMLLHPFTFLTYSSHETSFNKKPCQFSLDTVFQQEKIFSLSPDDLK